MYCRRDQCDSRVGSQQGLFRQPKGRHCYSWLRGQQSNVEEDEEEFTATAQ